MAAVEAAKYFTTAEPPCCNCPDWLYRGRERPCKHVKALQEAHALIAATNRKWEEKDNGSPGQSTRP